MKQLKKPKQQKEIKQNKTIKKFFLKKQITKTIHSSPYLPPPHPGGAVLYPGSGHLLLVDNIHQSGGIDAPNVDHRPLQGVPDPQVELHHMERERKNS